MEKILDGDIARRYAEALVAVARADDEINREEGQLLEHLVSMRSTFPIALDDLLLAHPLDHHELAQAVRTQGGPFRGASIDARELARMLVDDALRVVLAKGYVAEPEAQQIIRFATALGCTLDEVGAMSAHLVPWVSTPR